MINVYDHAEFWFLAYTMYNLSKKKLYGLGVNLIKPLDNAKCDYNLSIISAKIRQDQ